MWMEEWREQVFRDHNDFLAYDEDLLTELDLEHYSLIFVTDCRRHRLIKLHLHQLLPCAQAINFWILRGIPTDTTLGNKVLPTTVFYMFKVKNNLTVVNITYREVLCTVSLKGTINLLSFWWKYLHSRYTTKFSQHLKKNLKLIKLAYTLSPSLPH